MENTGYTTLTRQAGLLREMSVIANNIANSATTGYRQEGLLFSEFVKEVEGGQSISMATANVASVSHSQGALTQTGGTFDFAIEGDGFFLIETPNGERLTRSGAFSVDAESNLVTMDGHRVLDVGGTPIFIPPDARDLMVSQDGTISTNGQPLSQLGIYTPQSPHDLKREAGVMFRSNDGIEPVENAKIVQGFLESSNVVPVAQLARMIQVQRAYEMGQSFLDAENERVLTAIKTFVR